MVPGFDSESISVKDTLPPVVKARKEEAAVLNSLEVQDAWLRAYSRSGDANEHHVTKGWTWGHTGCRPTGWCTTRETRKTNQPHPHTYVGSIECTSQPHWSPH